MNMDEVNATLTELTVGTRPGDRRALAVDMGDATAVIMPIGKVWRMQMASGAALAVCGEGRTVRLQEHWMHKGALCLCIGDMSGPEFRVRGYIMVPPGREVAVTSIPQVKGWKTGTWGRTLEEMGGEE